MRRNRLVGNTAQMPVEVDESKVEQIFEEWDTGVFPASFTPSLFILFSLSPLFPLSPFLSYFLSLAPHTPFFSTPNPKLSALIPDGDGFISSNDLLRVVEKMGEVFSDEQCLDMIHFKNDKGQTLNPKPEIKQQTRGPWSLKQSLAILRIQQRRW